MQSSGNLGLGDMLGHVSSGSYATAVRGTCYGFSAAICGVVGVLVTYFFVPKLKGESLSLEDDAFRDYLVSKGWSGDMGEDDLKGWAGQVDLEESGSADGPQEKLS
jgi:hypothetical protein